jgi:hypothetical protein
MPTLGLTQPKNSVQVIRGTSKTFELTVTDEAGGVVNLTGSRIIMTVKRELTDSNAVIQKDSQVGVSQVELSEPKAGKAKIYFDPPDTQTLDVREYVFDVWVILASGKRYAVVPPSILEIVSGVTVIT